MTQRHNTISAIVVLVLVAVGPAANDAHAQAWVGDQGGLDASLDYNLGISDKVVGYKDLEFEDAGTTTHQITIGAEYVPMPKLAVNLAVPMAFLKYTGTPAFMHPGGGRYDDGDMNFTLTDLRAGARYQVLDEPLALSPHLAVSIPLADYETVGNTVAGRHLKKLHVGLGVGHIIGISTYVHLLYEFTLAEKYDRTVETGQHSQNYSDLAFTIGHKFLELGLDVHLDANVHASHGGMDFSDFAFVSSNEQLYHDAILDEDMFLAGGGVGYQVSNSVSVTAAARLFLKGHNTQNASVFALGVAWSPLP